ncbi:AzlD domain-containing protein [Pelosinus baikalensis]|jgi:branched-subunit amino acid transport protein|uniref:AzlD domain-containing protein n=1 Tax=Pelosinus baikalensis TaxID=2892015 RepID=A0ABS8HKZ7_9FIRM|nr:AzlD domain-containing protein [Pelosinus baikalensis]MCC5463851.1 AzlD domain-containing protein [Pelosinus baikalensis]
MRFEILMNILAMAVVTFVTRFASIGLLGDVPAGLGRFLKHVPTAILTALIAPALFAPKGYIALTFSNHYLLAGIVTALVAYNRQPPIVTMGAGMTMILVLRMM